MNIEQAIRQTKFKNDKQKSMINLIYTANWLNNKVNEAIKSYPITQPQYNVLRILRGTKGVAVSLKYIKERMLDKMPDVSRIIDKLYHKKFIDRKECAQDRRNVDVTITIQGLEMLAEMDQIIDPTQEIFNVFTAEECTIFNELLDKLRRGK